MPPYAIFGASLGECRDGSGFGMLSTELAHTYGFQLLITLEEGHVMQMQLLKLVDSNTIFYKHPLCNARRIKGLRKCLIHPSLHLADQ